MKLDLRWLKNHPNETQEFYLEEEADDLTLAGERIIFKDKITVHLVLTNTGRLIVGSGDIQTVLGLQCGRCLQAYSLPLATDFNVQLCEENLAQGLQEDEDFILFKGNEVDLDPVIVENILVNLPLRRLCSEDCPGFCPRCGVDLRQEKCRCENEETDPRWEVLKKLL